MLLNEQTAPHNYASNPTPYIINCLFQLDLQVDNLAQAKDRAQLTATG